MCRLRDAGYSSGKTFKHSHLLLRVGCAGPGIYNHDQIVALDEGRHIGDFQVFVRSRDSVSDRVAAANFEASCPIKSLAATSCR